MTACDGGPLEGADRVRLVDGDVDLRTGEVHRGAPHARLTSVEIALLAYLAARPGQDVGRYALLSDVWGYDDDVLSRTVDQAVRRLRTKIEVDPARPVHLLTVFGIGYRFEPAPEPAALAPRRDRFFGRRADLDRVLAELEHGLVTVVGPAGVGKTRLAEEVAPRLSAATRLWFAPLARATDASTLVRVVADALDVPADGPDPGGRLGVVFQSHGDGVLVLDNAEHLVPAVRDAILRWRSAAPGLRVLVTSRTPLGLAGERIVSLGPLDLADGVALLRDRIEGAGSAVGEEDEPVLRDLVARLDALPLALELAAARTRLLSLTAVRDRLAERLDLLVDRRREPHHVTLRAAFDESWVLLDPAERAAFAATAVFRAPFPVEAAEAILPCPADRSPLELIAGLVDHSLLRATGGPSRRLVLLENLRPYAAERLAELGGERAARDRHLAWFAERAATLAARQDGPGGIEAVRILAEALPDLLDALAHALATSPADAATIALALDALFMEAGPWDVHVRVHSQALAVSGDLPEATRAALHRVRAEAWRGGGHEAEAQVDADEAVRLAEASGSPGVLGRTLATRALLYSEAGAVDDALAHLQRAEGLARDAGDEWLQARVASLYGVVHMDRGYLVEVVRHSLVALDRFRRVGDERRAGGVLTNLGNALLTLGRPEEALVRYQEALDLARRAGARRKEAVLHVCLGNLATWQQRLDDAEAHYRAAVEGYRAIGLERSEAIATGNLGAMLVERERYDAAEAALTRALDVHRRLGTPRNAALVLGNLGVVMHLRDDLRHAAERLREGLALARQGSDERAQAYFRGHLAAVLAEAGEAEEAREALAAARAHAERLVDPDITVHLDMCSAIVDLALDPAPEATEAARRALEAIPVGSGPHIRVSRRLLERQLS